MTNAQLVVVVAVFLVYAYVSRPRIVVVSNDNEGSGGAPWLIAVAAIIGLIIMAQSKGCAPASFDGSDEPKNEIEAPERPTLDSSATPKPGLQKHSKLETLPPPPPAQVTFREQDIIVVKRFQPNEMAQAERLKASTPTWNMEVMEGSKAIWVIVRVSSTRHGQRLIDTWRREMGGLEELELSVIRAVLPEG